jgi:hypothetical protein
MSKCENSISHNKQLTPIVCDSSLLSRKILKDIKKFR